MKKKKTCHGKSWHERHINDPFVKKAQQLNRCSRSSFKIDEIQEKFNLFKKNQRILDCGAAPGGWSERLSFFTQPNRNNKEKENNPKQTSEKKKTDSSDSLSFHQMSANPKMQTSALSHCQKGDTDFQIVNRINEIVEQNHDLDQGTPKDNHSQISLSNNPSQTNFENSQRNERFYDAFDQGGENSTRNHSEISLMTNDTQTNFENSQRNERFYDAVDQRGKNSTRNHSEISLSNNPSQTNFENSQRNERFYDAVDQGGEKTKNDFANTPSSDSADDSNQNISEEYCHNNNRDHSQFCSNTSIHQLIEEENFFQPTIQKNNQLPFYDSFKETILLQTKNPKISERDNSLEHNILAIDLLPMKKIPGVCSWVRDLNDTSLIEDIMVFSGQKGFDHIVSDAMSNVTGNRSLDEAKWEEIFNNIQTIAQKVLKKNGSLVVKLWRSHGDLKKLVYPLEFEKICLFKPKSSRNESSEIYLIAQGLKKDKN